MIRITRLVLKSGMNTETHKQLPHAMEFRTKDQAAETIRALYKGIFPVYLGMIVTGYYTDKKGEEQSVWVRGWE